MPQLIREKLDDSLSTLRDVVVSRENLGVRLPSTDKILSSIRFLGERYRVFPEFDDVLRALEQGPPVISGRLTTLSRLLVEQAGETAHMTDE